MSAGFTDVTGITSYTRKFADNMRTKIESHRILDTEHTADFGVNFRVHIGSYINITFTF